MTASPFVAAMERKRPRERTRKKEENDSIAPTNQPRVSVLSFLKVTRVGRREAIFSLCTLQRKKERPKVEVTLSDSENEFR